VLFDKDALTLYLVVCLQTTEPIETAATKEKNNLPTYVSILALR